jgi:outer membrane lipoprotein-sorting protein
MLKKSPSLFLLFLGLLLIYSEVSLKASPATPPPSPAELAPLKAMLAAQKNVTSLSADFTQTRALRTLRSPLLIHGKLCFQAPDEFRWELGVPPKTIIIGSHDGLMMIQPFKKEAEKKQLSSNAFSNAGNLGMMRIPGGGNFDEFQKKVQILCIKTTGSRCHVEILPRDPSAARGLASINLDFDRVSGHWVSFELITREGSSLLNEFSNVQINPKISHDQFRYNLTGFKITDEKN